MNKKKTSLFKKFFFIGLIGFLFWILLQNNLLNKFDFETELKILQENKKNLSKDEFYNNLSKLHDKLEKKLKQEYGSVHSIEYALDFKCLNDCKIYKPKKECMRICMIPKVLIDNSYIWR